MFALSAWRDWNPDPQRWEFGEDYIRYGGWELPGRGNSHAPRLIPLTPVWPGFLINTFLYAAIVAVLFIAPKRIRRAVRRRRGRCVACGYDRRGNPSGACPECGRM